MDAVMSRHDDLVAMTFEQFKKSLDINVAADLVPFDDDQERETVLTDPLLTLLMRREVATFRETLMERMRDLADSMNDGVRLTAVKDLGKMLYKSRFIDPPIEHRHSDADGGKLPTHFVIEFVHSDMSDVERTDNDSTSDTRTDT